MGMSVSCLGILFDTHTQNGWFVAVVVVMVMEPENVGSAARGLFID